MSEVNEEAIEAMESAVVVAASTARVEQQMSFKIQKIMKMVKLNLIEVQIEALEDQEAPEDQEVDIEPEVHLDNTENPEVDVVASQMIITMKSNINLLKVMTMMIKTRIVLNL